MISNELSVIAKMYVGSTEDEIQELFDYYNKNCVRLVKPSRKYHIKRSDNWCAMFTSVIAHKAGLRMDNFPFEVSVNEQMKIAKEWGLFSRTVALPNSLVIYDWDGKGFPDHVGIVETVTNNVITVIEGNYKNAIGVRTVNIPNKQIIGYIKI